MLANEKILKNGNFNLIITDKNFNLILINGKNAKTICTYDRLLKKTIFSRFEFILDNDVIVNKKRILKFKGRDPNELNNRLVLAFEEA